MLQQWLEKVMDMTTLMNLLVDIWSYWNPRESGAIKLKNGVIDLRPLDKRLLLAMVFKYDNDIRSFLEWYEDEYRFSDKMVPVKPIPPELFDKRLNTY